jgi:tetratricopeptide (TPR) repeat protein
MTLSPKQRGRFGYSRLFSWLVLVIITGGGCAALGAASAEEYYSIGMAYFDIGKFEEAEKWLNRARAVSKTQVASEYNLGRIAFEAGRYRDAAGHFEAVLKRDPQNVLALKAAAYTRIKTGELEKAERLYQEVLALSPDSADDGYNYALVLYAMEKYAEAERALFGYQFALRDNSETMLLYARAQKAQGKVEAADSYAKWLVNNTDSAVRYEYAQFLETQELYARALEEYRLALSSYSYSAGGPERRDIRFALARVLLIADSDSDEGINELRGAVSEGFTGIEALEELLDDKRLGAAGKTGVTAVIGEVRRSLADAASSADGAASPGGDGDANAENAGKP